MKIQDWLLALVLTLVLGCLGLGLVYRSKELHQDIDQLRAEVMASRVPDAPAFEVTRTLSLLPYDTAHICPAGEFALHHRETGVLYHWTVTGPPEEHWVDVCEHE